MNVLVTGIDGFVGSHLATALLKIPEVCLYGIVRNLSRARGTDWHKANVTLLEADITEADQIRDAIVTAAPDKIFHLAGQALVSVSIERPRETFQTHVVGALNILETVRERREKGGHTPSVLLVSSAEVYGAVAQDKLPINEETLLDPSNPYSVSKACVDMIAQEYRKTFGVDVVIARPFTHLGPGQGESFVGSAFAKQIAEVKLGKRAPTLSVGNLEPERDFTDVRDVVQAYIKLLECPQSFSIFNVCSDIAIPVRTVLDTLLDISGVKVEITSDPSRRRANELPKILGDSSRLRKATGWKPVIPLRTTLQDILADWEHRLRTTK